MGMTRTHPQQPNIVVREEGSSGAGQGRFTSSEPSGLREVTYSPLHVLTSYSCCSEGVFFSSILFPRLIPAVSRTQSPFTSMVHRSLGYCELGEESG